MAKFDAGIAVEPMEYDFTAYGGSEGRIPEPSTLLVNTFFDQMREMFKEARAAQAANDDVDLEELSGEEMADALEDMDEKMAQATEFQSKSMEATATLCQNTPSVEDLQKLPYRVLTNFNKWLIREIAPKSEQSEEEASQKRPPTRDRRRAGGSQKRK